MRVAGAGDVFGRRTELNGESHFRDQRAGIRADDMRADDAMYKAKRAGRARVEVG